jgi:hypothetical protein
VYKKKKPLQQHHYSLLVSCTEPTPNILLISGDPGAGKSAVASSLVAILTGLQRLGSFFFFKRGDANLGDPAAFWRTVAHDLAQFHPAIKSSLVDFLTLPGFRDRDVLLHFNGMIEAVLIKHRVLLSARPPTIVIDALDECGWDEAHSSQRRILLDTLNSWSQLPKQFKLIITSRNERLPSSFLNPQHCLHIALETGDFTSFETQNDIRTFFRHRLSHIAPDLGFLPSWPGEPVIEQLTHRAAGLFIWAQTAVSFMEEGWCDPTTKLQLVLAGNLGVMNENVDILYQQILDYSFRGADDTTLRLLKVALGTIIVSQVPLHRDDLKFFMSQDGNVDEWRLSAILHRLSSVIRVTPLLRTRHLSFAEFLTDTNRCGDERFYIDKAKRHLEMWNVCMLIMKRYLQFNICRLESSYLRNNDISDLPERMAAFIPSHLLYSCRFWVAHLCDSTIAPESVQEVMSEINEFLHVNFLHWLETMSLVMEVSQLKAALNALLNVGIILQFLCYIKLVYCRLPASTHTMLPD